MKRICHMTSAHRSDDVRIFYKECTSLANAGYKVYLVAQGKSYYKNGVQIVGIEKSPRSRLGRMLQTTRMVYKAAVEVNADIYHLHDPELLPFALKLKRMGKKVMFDSHEDYRAQILHKEYIAKPLRHVISSFYKYYESYVIKNIDAVVIPCTFNEQNIFNGISKRTAYLDNFPFLSQHNDKFKDSDEPGDLKEALICYVGGLSYHRGITHLVKASYKAGSRLILAGKFATPGYREELMMMPEYHGVDYRGYLDCEGIVKVYIGSRIGMCTILNIGQYNTGDNFATKVYEYMSMGLPVIITDSPYARKVMKEYEFGICVQPDNVEEIASAIRYLLDNPDVAQQMGKNGRRAVLEKFNWGIEEKKLIHLYEDLLKES